MAFPPGDQKTPCLGWNFRIQVPRCDSAQGGIWGREVPFRGSSEHRPRSARRRVVVETEGKLQRPSWFGHKMIPILLSMKKTAALLIPLTSRPYYVPGIVRKASNLH